VLGVFWIVVGYGWFLQKQERVANGVARPEFPYTDYTLEELNKMYPQYLNVDVPTTQTPEETHQLFLATLKKGDLDGAVECCVVKSKQKEMRDGLTRVREKEQLQMMINDLDAKIKAEENLVLDSTNIATYYYSGKNNSFGSTINFTKNSDGKWLIESL